MTDLLLPSARLDLQKEVGTTRTQLPVKKVQKHSFRFFAVGSVGSAARSGENVAASMAAFAKEHPPDCILGLGDNFALPRSRQTIHNLQDDTRMFQDAWGLYLNHEELQVPWHMTLGDVDYKYEIGEQIKFTKHERNIGKCWRMPSREYTARYQLKDGTQINLCSIDTNAVEEFKFENKIMDKIYHNELDAKDSKESWFSDADLQLESGNSIVGLERFKVIVNMLQEKKTEKLKDGREVVLIRRFPYREQHRLGETEHYAMDKIFISNLLSDNRVSSKGGHRAVNPGDAMQRMRKSLTHLQQSIGNQRKSWKFCFGHHPVFSKGTAMRDAAKLRGDVTSDGKPGADLEQTLISCGAHAYLSGHTRRQKFMEESHVAHIHTGGSTEDTTPDGEPEIPGFVSVTVTSRDTVVDLIKCNEEGTFEIVERKEIQKAALRQHNTWRYSLFKNKG
eukprot:m.18967 g.18967  ORF g.18967 m.18967 type:complete len:449 (-) comp6460_c0_seq1:412-1758(-)